MEIPRRSTPKLKSVTILRIQEKWERGCKQKLKFLRGGKLEDKEKSIKDNSNK